MQSVKPIIVIDLFPQERKQLLELFSELEAKDWEKLLETISIIA